MGLDAAMIYAHTLWMNTELLPIKTALTDLIGCDYPIIAAPMFLISNVELVAAASNAGGIGGAPSLNWRSAAEFDQALSDIRAKTDKPYAINIIVNRANTRAAQDIDVLVKHKVPLVITSLGNPKDIITAVHGYGGKVFCDVTNLDHALKVQELGADGVIAVSSGAGGHAGPISPLVLIPHLKQNLRIPVIAAGGIVNGRQMLAALVLGADGVQIGTRFITSTESPASDDYKNAILSSKPEDIVLTSRISGTPASVINTDYIKKVGLQLSPFEKFLRANPYTSRLFKMLRYAKGNARLQEAAQGTTWKQVWSAGQGVGMIDSVLPAHDIMQEIVAGYWKAKNALSQN